MTLLSSILKKVKSNEAKYMVKSPPPEMEALEVIEKAKQKMAKKKKLKYSYVVPKIDNYPPPYDARRPMVTLLDWSARKAVLHRENVALLMAIKKMHFSRGRVDCHWRYPHEYFRQHYYNRVMFLKRVQKENKILYKLISAQGPKVESAAFHRREWARMRREIIAGAECKFVLFPVIPQDDIEDRAFLKPAGIYRPRVAFKLRIDGCAEIGELHVELFTDVCPRTCELFTELLFGHLSGSGFSYVGTHFFRKVPNLFWSGGDVSHDNGFGCYMQSGRVLPIGAENYHFSHSMAGLLSMRVTRHNEMCGIFNITFKPLPQFDLKNVVFGRVIRPSAVFNSMSTIGSALSSRPSVVLTAPRICVQGRCTHASNNTQFGPNHKNQNKLNRKRDKVKPQ